MSCIPRTGRRVTGTSRAPWHARLLARICGSRSDAASATSVYLEKDDKSYDFIDNTKGQDTPTTVLVNPELSDDGIEPPLPSTQKALVVVSKGQYEVQDHFPFPSLERDDEVIIKTAAVGLNPIDWKTVDYNFCLPDFPWVTGREMSGVVVKVGSGVKDLKPGMKVWTSTYYKDRRAGCFQEYVVAPRHIISRMPSSLNYEQAACLGVAALTASMTLGKWLKVSMQKKYDGDWLLIWGGSTITGQFATQMAKEAGLRIITVNSQSTKALSERLGAAHVVVRDGKMDEEVVEEILAITSGRISLAIDIVGPRTAALCLQAVSRNEDVQFAPLNFMAKDQVVPENVTAHTVEMKQFTLDSSCVQYAEHLNRLLEEGKVTVPELHVLTGGCDDIVQGLETQKRGNMGGKKIIVRF